MLTSSSCCEILSLNKGDEAPELVSDVDGRVEIVSILPTGEPAPFFVI